MSSRPTPVPNPTTSPISGAPAQQRRDVRADPLEALDSRRYAARPDQNPVATDEQGLGLDGVALGPPRHREDLLHGALAVLVDRQVHDQVHRRRDRGYD